MERAREQGRGMIAIVDYGAGNLGSVDKALSYIGAEAEVVSDPREVETADAVILPGVGAFDHCMGGLRARGLAEAVVSCIRSERPFLGICIGMQMLVTSSEEGGEAPGLGVVPGRVRRFQRSGARANLKVPHMGWNEVHVERDCPLFRDVPDDAMAYFVHSYYVVPDDLGVVAATTDYGGPFCSAISVGNVFATQFHPEKSGTIGLMILRNFAALVS